MCMTMKNLALLCQFARVCWFFLAALCNDDANGNVPLGKSCNRYWNCQGGYPRLQRCPAMLVFDRHSSRCVVPPTEDCDIPATPAPLEEQPANENEARGQVNSIFQLPSFCSTLKHANVYFSEERFSRYSGTPATAIPARKQTAVAEECRT